MSDTTTPDAPVGTPHDEQLIRAFEHPTVVAILDRPPVPPRSIEEFSGLELKSPYFRSVQLAAGFCGLVMLVLIGVYAGKQAFWIGILAMLGLAICLWVLPRETLKLINREMARRYKRDWEVYKSHLHLWKLAVRSSGAEGDVEADLAFNELFRQERNRYGTVVFNERLELTVHGIPDDIRAAIEVIKQEWSQKKYSQNAKA